MHVILPQLRPGADKPLTSKLRSLAEKYHVPDADVVLLAVNSKGALTDLPYGRIRFKLTLSNTDKTFYLGLPKKPKSPFSVSSEHKHLSLEGDALGHVLDAENDTCDTIYLRRSRTVLNLNSNSRSRCGGCAFCFDAQTPLDRKRLTAEDALKEFVEVFLGSEGKSDLSHLHQVAVVTGCFNSEDAVLRHMLQVQDVFSKFGFGGELLYFGSQVRSEAAFKRLKDGVPNPVVILSIECFSRRESLLNTVKASLTLDESRSVLSRALGSGISTTVSYIVGLDELGVLESGFERLQGHYNRFPILNVFQPHNVDQERLIIADAKELEYYLKARMVFERLLSGTGLRPRTWENYRSLWYFEFAGVELHEQTI